MAIDSLQLKMKKQNNVLMLDLSVWDESIPSCLLQEHSDPLDAYAVFCRQLLTGLKGVVCAVRFRFFRFAMLPEKGTELLYELLKYASGLGYYTLLDLSEISQISDAVHAAEVIWGSSPMFPCDGIFISGFYGSDLIKPFIPACEGQKKDIFVIARTPNKSSSEIQDLLSGSRTVHMAIADIVNRFSSSSIGKYGYSRVGISVSATAGDSIKMIRSKYPNLFMLVDGLDFSGANAKNCSYGFDKLGHGAIVSVGESVTCAWKDETSPDVDFVQSAVLSAKKIQKRLERYITIL